MLFKDVHKKINIVVGVKSDNTEYLVQHCRLFSHKRRSLGKNARLRYITARSTPLCIDHERFAVTCLLALLGSAFFPSSSPSDRGFASHLTHHPHTRSPMQLRFASFAVVGLWEDFHLQDRAHAGRTKKKGAPNWAPLSMGVASLTPALTGNGCGCCLPA